MDARFTGFRVIDAAPGSESFGAVRLIAWSDQPFGTNAFVRAWVGTEEVVGPVVDQFGLGFDGHLSQRPSDTDTLVVQIDGEEPVDTGLTVDPPTPIA